MCTQAHTHTLLLHGDAERAQVTQPASLAPYVTFAAGQASDTVAELQYDHRPCKFRHCTGPALIFEYSVQIDHVITVYACACSLVSS